MKERITLTIDKDILAKIDDRIDGSKIKNRSHAVELMLIKAFASNRPRKAVILARGVTGDSGEKKFIDLPSMLSVKNKSIIEWNLELLKKHGVKEVMICILEDAKSIIENIGDGSSMGLKIEYSVQDHPLGTAGSLKQVSNFVTETVIMCNADELKNIDIDDMFEFHRDSNKICTIALTTVENPSIYGVALMNGSKIVTFVEKPSKESAPSNLINAGLYILEPEILKYIPDGYSAIEQDVFPKLATQEKLFGYIFSGQWFPIKIPEKYEQAKNEWKGL